MKEYKISLLPKELKKKSRALKRWSFVSLALLIIAILSIFANILVAASLRVKTIEVSNLTTTNDLLEKTLNDLRYLETLENDLKKNSQFISLLETHRKDWDYVIKKVTNDNMFYGVNINKVMLDESLTEYNCLITGRSNSISNLQSWVSTLGNADGIDSVLIDKVDYTKDENGNQAIYFETQIVISKWNEVK